MFQLSVASNRQHQTLALNCLLMNNLFNLINCFNQFGRLNMKAGVKSQPFFVCVLVLAIFTQIALTELNAFGLENMNPSQWFFCFVFAILGDLIAPITGQQKPRQKTPNVLVERSKVMAPISPYVTAESQRFSRSSHSPSRRRSTKANVEKSGSGSKQRRSAASRASHSSKHRNKT